MSKNKLFEFLEKEGEVTGAKGTDNSSPDVTTVQDTAEVNNTETIQSADTDVDAEKTTPDAEVKPIVNTDSQKPEFDYKALLNKEQEITNTEVKDTPNTQKWKEFFGTEDEYIDYKLRKDGVSITPVTINKIPPRELVLNKLVDENADFGMTLKDAEEYLEQKYEKSIDEIFDSKLILIKEAKEAKEFYLNKFSTYKEPVQNPLPTEEHKPEIKREDTKDWVHVSRALMSDERQRVLKPYGSDFEYKMDEDHAKRVPEIMSTMAKNYGLELNEENLIKLKKVIDDQYILDNLAKIDKVRISDIEAKIREEYNAKIDSPNLNRAERRSSSEKSYAQAAVEFFKR